jgi:hypothetical protein
MILVIVTPAITYTHARTGRDLFSCFLHIQPAVFQGPYKGVILSEALRRSIATRGLYGAESKDPGGAYSQMLLGAFRPQNYTGR